MKPLQFLLTLLITLVFNWNFTNASTKSSWPQVGNSTCKLKGLKLDCSQLNLKSFPNELIKDIYRNITEINLSHNHLEELPLKFFTTFHGLRTLKLNDNPMGSKLNQMLDGWLPKLKVLDVSRTNLHALPSLQSQPNLRSLIASGNLIDDIKTRDLSNLKQLNTLILSKNRLNETSLLSLRKLELLTILNLNGNDFGLLRRKHFKNLENLQNLTIISHSASFEKTTFSNMSELRHLKIASPNLKEFPNLTGTNNLMSLSILKSQISSVPASSCFEKEFLEVIEITYSLLSVLPDFRGCRNLVRLDLTKNYIKHIGSDAFAGMEQLQSLSLVDRSKVRAVHVNAFRSMPALSVLYLSDIGIDGFLNLTGTHQLTELSLMRCSLTFIPANFCQMLPSLRTLDITANEITSLPSFSNCLNLISLTLNENKISSIDSILHGLTKLVDLMVNHNKLSEISNGTLSSLKSLQTLSLNKNQLAHIDADAFKELSSLQTLSLRNNRLTSLPTRGLKQLMFINTKGNKDLITFPSHSDLPNIRKLTLDYPYHCCYFSNKGILSDYSEGEKTDEFDYEWEWDDNSSGTTDFGVDLDLTKLINNSIHNLDNDYYDPLIDHLSNSSDVYIEISNESSSSVVVPFIKKGEEHLLFQVTCLPQPDEFYPCEDLMGRQWLRVCVWLVFFLALFGNAVVLFVISVNSRKMDVPRYLIMNLAFADLCLGVYLGFLATVDLITLGDFRAHALHWQFSSSCKTAGFVAVFASELSVFTLTVITVERYITIKHSLRIEKRIDTRKAIIIMAFGWALSLLLASLPLIKIPLSSGDVLQFSDYSKYSICLPFEVSDRASLGYVATVILLNVAAFSLIVFCYVKIFLTVRGKDSFNPTDSRVAKRMALLIFTDFACWFPITLITLTAMFNYPLVDDLWVSKVFTVLVFPLNACANPFLYAILTNQFRKDCVALCRRLRDPDGSLRYPAALKFSRSGSKGSNYTPYRRESSCSFLFSRRGSARPEELKAHSRTNTLYKTPMTTDDEREMFDRETSL